MASSRYAARAVSKTKPSAGRPSSSSARIRSLTLWETFPIPSENRAERRPSQSPRYCSKDSSAMTALCSPVPQYTPRRERPPAVSTDTWSAARQSASSRSACPGSVTVSTVTAGLGRSAGEGPSSGLRPKRSMSLVNSSFKNSGYAPGPGALSRLSSGENAKGASVTIVASQRDCRASASPSSSFLTTPGLAGTSGAVRISGIRP